MPPHKAIAIDTIANFEKTINKDGAGFKNDVLLLPGTLTDRYRGLLMEGPPVWLRTQFHSLFIVVEGQSKIYIGDKDDEVTADCLIIIPENMLYIVEELGLCRGYCLHFHTEFLKPILSGHLTEQFPFFNIEARHIFRLTDRESRLLQNCFKDLIRAFGHKTREKELLMRDFLHILLLHIRSIYSTFSRSVPAAVNRAAILSTRFLHFVEQHFRDMHEVRQYADLLHISPKYLSKIVKETLGKSPQTCIQDMLLLEAKLLLKTTDKTISEIAYLLSFTDQSHFSHFIKKHTGRTPLNLRMRG